MKSKLFIHAPNVHQGGGRSLLEPLLGALNDQAELILCLDERMPLSADLANNQHIKRVKPSVVQRLHAENWLAQTVRPNDKVLCFGNLPPLFKLQGHTVVFIQNRYLIDDVPLNKFPLKVRLRLAMERLWLSAKLANANEFVVQTPTMKRFLESKIQGAKPVHIFPFVAMPKGYMRNALQTMLNKNNDFDFLYVASGEPHKNHQKLLEAWCLLAQEGLFPSLCLTLQEACFAKLCQEVEAMRQQHNLQVINVGDLHHHEVLALYARTEAVIYPSIFESFGLPLIEARQANLPVLAPELDYVRDVLDPEQTFDPNSAMSIARAVKRFMKLDEQPLPLLDAASFMESIFKKAK
jgi:glycosyltransferase involved in cell wall biosynthesis